MQLMRKIISLARLVVLDGLRRHAVMGLLVFALACEVGGLLFFDFIPRDIGRASSDFIFSVSWLAGLVFLFFHAVQVMAWDEDRRVIHTLLARPISRSEYTLGVFIGLSALLLVLNLVLGSLGWGVLLFIKSQVDTYYFSQFSMSCFLLTWLGIFAAQLSILSVIVLFSGLVRGSFTVMIMAISYYLTCNGLPVVRDAVGQNPAAEQLGQILLGLSAIFPDFGRLDFKMNVATDNALPELGTLFGVFGSSLIYVALVLWFACLIYGRRDLK